MILKNKKNMFTMFLIVLDKFVDLHMVFGLYISFVLTSWNTGFFSLMKIWSTLKSLLFLIFL